MRRRRSEAKRAQERVDAFGEGLVGNAIRMSIGGRYPKCLRLQVLDGGQQIQKRNAVFFRYAPYRLGDFGKGIGLQMMQLRIG